MSLVSMVKTTPNTILMDYHRLLSLSNFTPRSHNRNYFLKVNVNWCKFIPACSTPPWELEGVLDYLILQGIPESLIKIGDNRTSHTNFNQAFNAVGLKFVQAKHKIELVPLDTTPRKKIALVDNYPALRCAYGNHLLIPEIFFNANIIHLATLKPHGRTVLGAATKSIYGAFLPPWKAHYGHYQIHSVVADLMALQYTIAREVFAVVDATIVGTGKGPVSMGYKKTDYLIAGYDPVAVDAVCSALIGWKAADIEYLRLCQERSIGEMDLNKIEIVGDIPIFPVVTAESKVSMIINMDNFMRQGKWRRKILVDCKLDYLANLVSAGLLWLWYFLVGLKTVRKFKKTEWGSLWLKYIR